MTKPIIHNLEERKNDHLRLTEAAQLALYQRDERFNYEPLFSPLELPNLKTKTFLKKQLRAPLWISSMTGGAESGKKINYNLAKACQEFGLGMGLGSCRPLLEDKKYLADFDLRPILGSDRPFYANLGIAQVEELLKKKQAEKINELINTLEADGLIIHINPLQEYLQSEGDRYLRPPMETIEEAISKIKFPLIVKEVGQGMGPKSLRALLKLPLAAIELAALGGTNFSKLELQRSMDAGKKEVYQPMSRIGHSAEEMIYLINQIEAEEPHQVLCRDIIISGGIKTFLDGHYLMQKCHLSSVYGQASSLLKYAKHSYESLRQYIEYQIEALKLAQALLNLRERG
ncbi:MAG: type 2 isopentenyl-diphosphate Delta-isomerase [Deltaproteobacteria bacterium]|nr:type 2 isopentenyl-diphosphate Delta-isomerase [Deltaproteobacteria bacterium]